MKRRTLISIGLLIAAGIGGNAHADARLDYVDDATRTLQTRISVAPDRLRIDPAGLNGAYLVLDLRTQTLTQIDPQHRTTTTSTIAQLTQLIRSLDSAGDPAAKPLLQLMLGNLPPAERARAERVLAQMRHDRAIAFTRSGETAQVGGIRCEVYVQRGSAGDVRRLCSAAFADLGLAPDDARTLQTALDLLRQTGGPWLRAAQVPGLPLRYAGSLDAGAFSGTGHLARRHLEPLPADHFVDPPGYRIASIFEMLARYAPPSNS